MKKGFSLIELLVVIAIISLFGFLIFGSLKQAEIKKDPYTIKALKETLADVGDAELLCIDKCSKCFIHAIGDDDMKEVSSDLKELKAYIVDGRDNPEKLEFGRWKDHKICLRYRHYANGSSTQIILESEGKFYYFPTFFGEVGTYDSVEDATTAWISETDVVRNRGNYY